MSTDIRKKLETVLRELNDEQRQLFAQTVCANMEIQLREHLRQLPEDEREGLGIEDFHGPNVGNLYKLCKKISENPASDYKDELNAAMEGIDQPAMLRASNTILYHIGRALDGMVLSREELEAVHNGTAPNPAKITREVSNKLSDANFRLPDTTRTDFFDQNPEMEELFHGRDPMTKEELNKLKQDTAKEREEYANRLGDQLVAVFADAREGDDLYIPFKRAEDFFTNSVKFEMGEKFRMPSEDVIPSFNKVTVNAMERIKDGEPPIAETHYPQGIRETNIFNGDKEELERRLREEARKMAEADVFMYFKDNLDNLSEYVKTGNPQLLNEDSSLRYIDNVKQRVIQEVHDTFANESYEYEAGTDLTSSDIADRLFEEYKQAGEIGDRLKYYSTAASALNMPLATQEAQKGLQELTNKIVDYECRDEEGKLDRDKIRDLSRSIAKKQADLSVQRGKYENADQQFSQEEVQNALFVQYMAKMYQRIDTLAAEEGLKLPAFGGMVQADHLMYAEKQLALNPEDKAAFDRTMFGVELSHKPAEKAMYDSAVGQSGDVTDYRMIQASGSLMKNNRNFFLGQREIDMIDGILENMEKTGKGYFRHTNTEEYNKMKSDLKTYRDTLEKISNNPLLATDEQLKTLAALKENMTSSARNYLSDKTTMRWHDSGVERQNAALGILAVFDRDAAQDFQAKANNWRVFRRINLEELENKLQAQGLEKHHTRKKAGSHEEIKRARTMDEGPESAKPKGRISQLGD